MRRAGLRGEATALHAKDIEPAIAVEIQQRTPPLGHLGKVVNRRDTIILNEISQSDAAERSSNPGIAINPDLRDPGRPSLHPVGPAVRTASPKAFGSR